jgi:hypothetical protein
VTSDSGDSVNYRPHGSYALDGPPNDALNFYSRLLFDRDMPPLPRRPGDFVRGTPPLVLVEADRNRWLDPGILRREDPS